MAVVGAGVGIDEWRETEFSAKTINKNNFITSNFDVNDISSFSLTSFFFQWKRMFASHTVFTSRISSVADNGQNQFMLCHHFSLLLFFFWICYRCFYWYVLSKWVMRASWIDRDNIIINSARCSEGQQHSNNIGIFVSLPTASCIHFFHMKWDNKSQKKNCDVRIDTKWPQMKNSTNEVKNEVETEKKYLQNLSVSLVSMWKLKWNICCFFSLLFVSPVKSRL